MRNFKSKAVCLLSSAVLLCGASGMTANAATDYSFTATSRPTITAMTVSEYYLDTGNGMRVYGSGTGYCVITDAAGNKITSNTANVTKDIFLTSNYCSVKYAGRFINCEGSYIPSAYEPLRIYVPTSGGTGRYKYTWEKYAVAYYGGQEAGVWQTIDTTSEKCVDLDFDDIIYTSTNYDAYNRPYTTKHYERRIRCRISTLDENGNALATHTTGESLIYAFDPAVVNPYDPNWAGNWE